MGLICLGPPTNKEHVVASKRQWPEEGHELTTMIRSVVLEGSSGEQFQLDIEDILAMHAHSYPMVRYRVAWAISYMRHPNEVALQTLDTLINDLDERVRAIAADARAKIARRTAS